MKVQSPLGLLRDNNGQVLLLGVIALTLVLTFMLLIPNVSQVTTRKMRVQTAADAGAFSGSIWLARGLNLNANMNVGIRSMYTWMTVLTVSSALARALYSDTLDPSVRALGQGITLALFGNSDPQYCAREIYEQTVEKLAHSAQWLRDLQKEVAGSFPRVAEELGTDRACQNASGGDPSSLDPAGRVLVGINDSLSLVEDASGDSLLYGSLTGLASALTIIPTNDSNIGPAKGRITIDSSNLEIRAVFGDSSTWCTVRQVIAHMYRDYIRQIFYNTVTHANDSGFRFFDSPGGKIWAAYLQGDSWVSPFVNPPWTLVDAQPGNNKCKRDTVVIRNRVVRTGDPQYNRYVYHPWVVGDSILPEAMPHVNNGDFVDSSTAVPTDFYCGGESTAGKQGDKHRALRLKAGAKLYAVSYVWQSGDNESPRGLGPVMGKLLFPRDRVAPQSPMLAVARSEAYLAKQNPTVADYFFTPAWDVRLTPLDSVGAWDIVDDNKYHEHHLDTFNLENLRKYVLVP
jgi:hypothetical protein